MESLNVKNINDEKIFNVIDPNGQGEVVNRIRPISISINQKAQTINDQTDSTINLAVYWNDTWKSILDLTFDESLRQEYGKLVEDLTAIQKDIDMKQYKDAETKTADFLKYVANLSNKYTSIPETSVVAETENDFVKVTAERNSVKATISDSLLNFMLKKFAKVDNLDYAKANECFSTSKFNFLANNYDFYYHSPEIFQKQAYMTVVKDNKVVGSYKVNYDQFSKFASKFMLTPQKLGYSKDKMAGYMKTAEVVMQNIFFDSVDEAKEWQEMVDEKKREQATTPEGEEETTETTTTETKTKTEIGEGKSESPIKEDGGLARPSEGFASDEMPESQPRQQDQQGGGQNLGASRKVKNVKKTAKVGYNAEPETLEEELAIDLAEEIDAKAALALEKAGMFWGGYSGEEERAKRVEVAKEAIKPLIETKLKQYLDQPQVTELVKEHLTDINSHITVSAIEEILNGKQASKKTAEEITQIEENYKEKDFNIKYKNLVIKDNVFVQEELKAETTRVKVEFVVYGYNIPNGMAEANFNCIVKPSKANATIPHIEKYTINYDVALDNETKKQLDDILYNLSNKKIQDFCKYNDKGYLVYKYQVAASKKVKLNKKALYGDVQEQDIVPAKTETKVYLQSEDKESKTEKCFICEKEFPIKDMKKEKSVGYMCNDCIDKMKANGYGLDVESLKKAKKNKTVSKQAEEELSRLQEDADKYIKKDVESTEEYLKKYLEKSPELFKAQYGVETVEEALKLLKEKNPNWYKKAEEQTVEEKIEEQVADDTVKGKIGVGDIVALNFDNVISSEDFPKYEEFIGKPMLLMETDKEDINKVIIEETEYPFQRITVDAKDVVMYEGVKGEDVIVEDVDGDEMITTFEELPVVAKQCKIKSIHKAANINKKKSNLTKKAINSLEDVAGLIDTIWSDYDWYEYADALEVGEKSHYENILADVQKDEKGTIEGILKLIEEDDDGYTAPEIEQLKEYYNAKFGGK